MEMSEHKVFNFFTGEDGPSRIIVKTGNYSDGSAKIEIVNLQNQVLIEATACCNNFGLDSNDAIIASDGSVPGLMSFLESHNVVRQQDEYINIQDAMHPVVKLLPESEWMTEIENGKLFIINEFTIFAKDPHQAFQLYLFALQADAQTIEY